MAAVRRPVLVVEDDADQRTLLTELLEVEGYRVLVAENGASAIDLLHRTPEVGLILLDLMMPVMDGYQFRSQQVQDPAIAAIPVILLTADGNAVYKAGHLGAVEAMRKPLEFDRLLALVARYC